MVPDNSTGISRVPAYSGADSTSFARFVYGALTLYGQAFLPVPLLARKSRRRSYNPGTRVATPPVWAYPRSLAATGGIVLTFFSCRYLDVSVPCVRFRASHG